MLAQHLLQALKRHGEAAGADVWQAEVCEHGVVVPSGGKRSGNTLSVCLEDQSRIVVETIYNGKVKTQTPLSDQWRATLHQLAEIADDLLSTRHTRLRKQALQLVHDALVTVEPNDLAQRLRLGSRKALGRTYEVVQAHKVGAMYELQDLA